MYIYIYTCLYIYIFFFLGFGSGACNKDRTSQRKKAGKEGVRRKGGEREGEREKEGERERKNQVGARELGSGARLFYELETFTWQLLVFSMH